MNLATQSVYGAKKNLRVKKGEDGASMRKVLDCARDRLATYNLQVRKKYLQTGAVEITR